MSTPTAHEAWLARAMELAEAYGMAYVDLLESGKSEAYGPARAALEAHLRDVPMGEPVGYYQRELDGSISRVSWWHAIDPDVFPLYTKPEGMK